MSAKPRGPITETIDRFVDSCNVQDLDLAMSFFAEDAEYLPGDGSIQPGPAQFRAAFVPISSGKFGLVTFDEHDRLIDDPRLHLGAALGPPRPLRPCGP
ncbi:nuclear transport factor 2 family protein [Streptomyces sp. HC44]|uniref:Nuclear transport factor 2 family protein n=1 Tax=Streptomyces scabichelini TaxID=2711217 RepID=A0A6G4VKQ4_9ACTN|nr:nuclear transport factor 2 family protein [Streptomyces scabichelini]NGO14367.1 nuclear transport factor 2 family protein [Streptomyces scabichelini]